MTDEDSLIKHDSKNKLNFPEWILAGFGALNCFLAVGIFTFFQLSLPDGGLSIIWPFPAIYFLEIITLGILCVIAVAKSQHSSKSSWTGIPWICSGTLLAFVILGAWTIGFFLIPAMVVFLIVGILIDRRTQGDHALHSIYFVAAGIAQASIVFLTLLTPL